MFCALHSINIPDFGTNVNTKKSQCLCDEFDQSPCQKTKTHDVYGRNTSIPQPIQEGFPQHSKQISHTSSWSNLISRMMGIANISVIVKSAIIIDNAPVFSLVPTTRSLSLWEAGRCILVHASMPSHLQCCEVSECLSHAFLHHCHSLGTD